MPLIAKNIILSATLMIGVGTTSLTLAQTSQPPVTPSVTTAQADVLETNDAPQSQLARYKGGSKGMRRSLVL